MAVIFHPRVQKDLNAALSFYETEGGPRLADRFFSEVTAVAEKVGRNPQYFHFAGEGRRRVALDSFPYHFLFEERPEGVLFLVLRHDKRHPSFGLRRK